MTIQQSTMPNRQSSFSIITPSFNQLDWLRLCIASVRDQVEGGEKDETGKLNAERGGVDSRFESQVSGLKSQVSPPLAVEHIIQDAGTPGIEEFAREVGADFYRDGNLISHSPFRIPNYSLTIYCETDSGMYDAVNRGFSKAKGDFLAYLNCDEQYLPGALHSVVDYFSSHVNLDILFGDAIIAAESGAPLAYRAAVIPTVEVMRAGPLGILTCATFLRSEIFSQRNIRFDPELKIVGDYRWYADMVRARLAMEQIQIATSVFTLMAANLSQTHQARIEGPQWDREKVSYPNWRKYLELFLYAVRKVAVGMYLPHKCSAAFYTLATYPHRKSFSDLLLTDRWPKHMSQCNPEPERISPPTR
jgi:glycosyltransferase involved in cell wall biosynthesis